MSELEIVLMFAFGVMLYLWKKASNQADWFKSALIAVGKKEAYIEIDEREKTFCIKEAE
jgi:hypothetical protein